MARDTREFWRRIQSGVSVAVAGDLPDKLLGVRDGLQRFFDANARWPGGAPQVTVRPYRPRDDAEPLPMSDAEILGLARRRARALDAKLATDDDAEQAFVVGVEAGLFAFRAGDETRHFVRSWAVVRGSGDEAWGSSGAVQLPTELVDGLGETEMPRAVLGGRTPGMRRHGGMVHALTGGIEGRRSATALATFHAVATLLHGVFAAASPSRQG